MNKVTSITNWNGVTLYTEKLHEEDPRIPEAYEGRIPLFQVDVWAVNSFRIGFTVRAHTHAIAAGEAKKYLTSTPPMRNVPSS